VDRLEREQADGRNGSNGECTDRDQRLPAIIGSDLDCFSTECEVLAISSVISARSLSCSVWLVASPNSVELIDGTSASTG
jgi:hypothetical protein